MPFSLPTITDNTPIRGSQGRQLVANDQHLNEELLARPKVVRVALGQTAGNGGVFAWQNPTGSGIIVTRVVLWVTVAQAGQTIDIGRTSAAAAASDDLLDGASIANITQLLDNITNKGTNGATLRKMNAAGGGSDWITGTASGTPSSLAGFVYITYMLA